MNLNNVVKTVLQYVYWIIYLYNVHFKRVEPPKPTFAQKQQEDYNMSCKKYEEFYNASSDDENANIDPILYKYEDRKGIFDDPANIYEKQWKSRVMYDYTPRGNVLMYYNPYTLAFTYHSDEQTIPYTILQKMAIKYVTMYRCKDFYIDPDNRPTNKMLDLLQKEEDAMKSKNAKINDITKVVGGNTSGGNVYASLKDYRSPSASTTTVKKSVPITKFSNKFVRIGKINDYNILAIPPSAKVQATNDLLFVTGLKTMNDYFNDLDIVESPMPEQEPEQNNPTTIFSFAMFKKLKNKNIKPAARYV